jgi:hypothetical protein
MKRLKYATSVVAVVALVVTAIGLVQVFAAPTAATVTFVPSTVTVAPTDTFDVTINVQVDEGINAATTSFTYDTTCLNVTGIDQPVPDGLDMSLGTNFNDTTGTVTVNEGKLIGSVNGSVDIVIVHFEVESPCAALGDVPLAFGGPANMIVEAASSTPVDPTTWVDGLVTIQIEPPTSITLEAAAPGEIGGDGTLDLTATVDPMDWPGTVEFTTSAGTVTPTASSLVTTTGQAMTTLSLSCAQAAGLSVITVTADASGLQDTAVVDVVAGAAAEMDIAPLDTTAQCGDMVAYTVVATDVCGIPLANPTADASYSVVEAGHGGSWTANSYTAGTEGTWTISVTLGSLTEQTSLMVSHSAAASVAISATAEVTAGQSVAATATAMDACGNTWDVTGDSTFDTTGGSCLGSSCTITEAGTQTVTVTYDGFSDETTVTVNPDKDNPASVDLTPAAATVTVGDAQAYMLTAFDTYDNDWDVTAEAGFMAEAGAGGSWATNVYTSENVGVWTVTGSWDVFSDTATLTVQTAPALVADISAPVADEVVEPPTDTGLFTVTATISNTGEAGATGVSATLAAVGDVTLVSNATQTVGDIAGGGVSSAINWTLQCMANGAVTVTVTPAGNDANNGLAITALSEDTVAFSQEVAGVIYLPIVLRTSQP